LTGQEKTVYNAYEVRIHWVVYIYLFSDQMRKVCLWNWKFCKISVQCMYGLNCYL